LGKFAGVGYGTQSQDLVDRRHPQYIGVLIIDFFLKGIFDLRCQKM
jgi:hypothetical protein